MKKSLTQLPVTIRACQTSDMSVVQLIYREQVLHGTASFEETPPTIDVLLERRNTIVSLGLPYLVACIEDSVVGYAYAGRYRPRSAYRHTAENSVYVHQEKRGLGIGKLLLLETIKQCEAIGLREMVAVIGDSENHGSIALHSACGFETVGTLRRVGYKHGRWVDTVVMQRALSPVSEEILPPLDF